MRGNWKVDEFLEIVDEVHPEGVLHQYKGRTADGIHLSMVRHHDQWPVTFKESDIVALMYQGKVRRVLAPGEVTVTAKGLQTRAFEAESEKTKEASDRMRAYVELFSISGIEGKSGPKVKAFIEDFAAMVGDPNPPSEPTFVRWLNRSFKDGIYDAGACRVYFGSRGGKSRLNPMAEKIIAAGVLKYKTKVKTPRKGKAIEEIVNYNLEKAGLPIVSRSHVYRQIKKLNVVDAALHLRGWTEARKLLPFGDAPQSRRILECGLIDHTPLDIYVLSPCRRYILERPIITAVLDDHSGMVLGHHIGFKPPSAWTVMLALRNAMKPKVEVLNRHPIIRHPWPAHGQLSMLRCDNGPEFHGHVLKAALRRLGTVVAWCGKHQPWLKGAIENLFHVLNSELRQIPGAIFNRATFLGQGEYDPKKAAIFTMDELIEYVNIFFCDYFHLIPDQRTGLSRLDVWNASEINFPPHIAWTNEDLDIILSRLDTASLGSSGIRLNGLKYLSTDPRFEALYGLRPKDRRNIQISSDDGDVSALRLLADGEWIPVPCTDVEEYRGMSLDLLEAINAATLNAKRDHTMMLEGERRETRHVMEGILESAQEKTVESHRLTREMQMLAKRRQRELEKANKLIAKSQEPVQLPPPPPAQDRVAEIQARLEKLRAESGVRTTVDGADK